MSALYFTAINFEGMQISVKKNNTQYKKDRVKRSDIYPTVPKINK